MASVVATAAATRLLPKFSAPWPSRGHVALPLSPGRPLAVTVAAAPPRPGEGGRRGKKRRRARGADQEDGLSLSSGEPRPRLEMETTNSTPRTRADKGAKPAPEASMTRKGSAIRRVTLVVLAAVFFGASIALRDGVGTASEYFAGYLLEQSLSVDNLFVFVLVFKYFKVPQEYQSRVLSYGIAGAVILRAVMIILGAATIQRFEAVNLLLALILLFSSYKLFAEDDEESDLSDNFIVKTCQKFIPVTGLRSLYVLISESMSELEYLQPAIGIILGFIGTKMIFDFFGYHIPTEASLAIVTTCLSGGVILSLRKASTEEQDK